MARPKSASIWSSSLALFRLRSGLSRSGLDFMFNMMLEMPPLIATKIHAAPRSGTDKREMSRPIAHFVSVVIDLCTAHRFDRGCLGQNDGRTKVRRAER